MGSWYVPMEGGGRSSFQAPSACVRAVHEVHFISAVYTNGMAERKAALDILMRIPGSRPLSVGADRGYDTRDFVAECRELNITPHVARKKRWSAIDGRTTRHEAYRSSQKVRKRVESIFGWMKTVGGFRRSRYVGLERTVWGVGCDGLQPGEDVEVDTRAGD